MKKLPINLNAFIFTSYMHENFANKFKYIYFGYFSYPICMTNLLIKFFMTKNYFHNNGVPPVSSKLFFFSLFPGFLLREAPTFLLFLAKYPHIFSSPHQGANCKFLLPPIANIFSRQLQFFFSCVNGQPRCNFIVPFNFLPLSLSLIIFFLLPPLALSIEFGEQNRKLR